MGKDKREKPIWRKQENLQKRKMQKRKFYKEARWVITKKAAREKKVEGKESHQVKQQK